MNYRELILRKLFDFYLEKGPNNFALATTLVPTDKRDENYLLEINKLLSEKIILGTKAQNNQLALSLNPEKMDIIKRALQLDKIKFLFVAANPSDSSRLRLDKEMRGVEEEITRMALHRDNFEFKKIVAARRSDLQRQLLEYSPNFVHFSGHGSQEGIYVEDENGASKVMKTIPLSNLFKLFSDSIRCVFLNSCYAEEQAKEIIKHIPNVIGMKKAVPDNLAIEFSIAFYKALASNKSINFAFEFAKNSVDLDNIKDGDIPVLLSKDE